MNEYLNELFVSVESGEITAEDAAELYSIFSEAEETEESGGAHQKLLKMKDAERNRIETKLSKLKDLIKATDSKSVRKRLEEKYDNLREELDNLEIPDFTSSPDTILHTAAKLAQSQKGKNIHGNDKSTIRNLKASIGVGKEYMPKAKKAAGYYTKLAKVLKESVTEDDLKLAIYEAYETGEITEDEKYELLSDLY